MAKKIASGSAGPIVPLLNVDSQRAIPLYEQLYRGLREQILRKRLAPGSRLASTRTLAVQLGVSRFTVVYAMERLLAEGYLTARRGSGTFVVETVPEQAMLAPQQSIAARTEKLGIINTKPRLSRRGTAMSSVVITGPRPGRNQPRAFHPRRAPLDVFPLPMWTRIMRRQWRNCGHDHLDYGDPAGFMPLRAAIAAHISVTRAVRCSAHQVVVTSGSQQAFDILFRLLLDPGDDAWIEEPGYLDVRAALIGAGAHPVPIPVDASGMDVGQGVRLAPQARLAVVSPSHQYPSGATLSASRRGALLEWARASRSWIVEDDYDSYFRYSGRPMSALQGVDADAVESQGIEPCVLYVGTFSKTVFPSLRLGFCVVPDALVSAVTNARAVADRNSPIVDQAALAEFIVDGHYDRHLRRVRVACQERYEAMQFYCSRLLAGELSLSPVSAGTHVLAYLARVGRQRVAPHGDAVAVAAAAADEDLVIFPLSRYCLQPPHRDALVLGFGGLSPRRIAVGMERLARTIGRVRRTKT